MLKITILITYSSNKLLVVQLIGLLLFGRFAFANPEGGMVVAGAATIDHNANGTTIHQTSERAVVNWHSFNINPGEQTQFVQPTGGVILNRIDANQGASQILGNLSSNATVVLVNQAGVFFGKDAQVNVGGIIASTLDITDQNFMQNKLIFNIPGKADASIINAGTITTNREHGLVAMLGHTIRNDGLIDAKLSKVVLAHGEDITVDLNGDDIVLFGMPATFGSGIDNSGRIIADGGQVLLTANVAENILDSAINMQGLVQANSVDKQNGKLIFYSSNAGDVSVSGKMVASGKNQDETGGFIRISGSSVKIKESTEIDVSGNNGGGEVLIGGYYQGAALEYNNAKSFYVGKNFKRTSIYELDPAEFTVSKFTNSKYTYVANDVVIRADALVTGDAGAIVLWSDGLAEYGPKLSATTSSFEHNGGFIEMSGKHLVKVTDKIDTRTASGMAGEVLFDPADLIVQTAGGSGYSAGSNNLFTNNPSGTTIITPASIVAAAVGANITLQANNDLTFSDPLAIATSTRTLTCQAGRSILVNAAVSTTNGAISFTANDSSIIAAGTSANRSAGAGNITASGSGTVSSGTAALTMTVGSSSTAPMSPGSMNLLGLTGGAVSLTTPNAVAATTVACTSLSVDVGSNSSITGIISGTGATLTKLGSGLLDLLGANTYTGATTISAGTLRASNVTALGTTAAGTTVSSGATLEINGVAIGAEPLTLNGTGVGGNGALIGTGTSSHSGAIALASNTTIGGTGTLTLSGIMSGAFNLTKVGTGTISLSGANTYSGTTLVSAGTLRASNATGLGAVASAITVADGATLDINAVAVGAKPLSIQGTGVGGIGALTGTGTASYGGTVAMLADTSFGGTGTFTLSGIISGAFNLTKIGTSTISFSGANTYSGTTSVSAGTLRASNATGLGSLATAVTVANGATLDINGVAVGSKPMTIQGTGVGGVGALTGTGTGSYAGAITLAGDTSFGGTGTLTLSGIISGGFNVAKIGTSSISFSGANTYSGTTSVNAGTLRASNATALGSNATTITVASGATLDINAVAIGAKPLSISGAGVGGAGALTGTGTGSYAGAITMTADTTYGGAGTTTLSGAISGGFNLTKAGAGIVILSAANSYTGSTIVNAGTLRVSADNQLGTVPGGFTANNIILGGGTLNATAAFEINQNRGINLTANSTIQANVTSLIYKGTISGIGFGFTKTGAGTMSLGGANTFSGPLTINRGILLFTQSNSVANCSALTLANTAGVSFQLNGFDQTIGSLSGGGATGGAISLGANSLSVNQTVAGNYAGSISGTGNFILSSSSTNVLTLSGTASTFTGIYTLNGGSLLITSDSNLGTAPGTPTAGKIVFGGGTLIANSSFTLNANRGISLSSGGGILQTNPGFTLTYDGIIAGADNLTKTGGGTFSTAGVHTYTGSTNINDGTFLLRVANALSTSSGINLANVNGAILDANSFSQTIKNLSGGGTVGGKVLLGSADFTINETTSTAFDGEFSGSGNIILSNTSTGTLSLTNSSGGFTGNFTLNGGTLAINSDLNLGAVPALATANKLNFNGGILSVVSDVALSSNRGIRILAGGATFGVSPGKTLLYNGIITGSAGGALIKNGNGTLSLGGINTYDGATNISAGILSLTSTTALGNSSATTVSNGATLDLNFNSGTLANTNQITLNGSGFGGLGALTLSGTSIALNNPLTIATSATISGTGTGSMSFGGVVTANASLSFVFNNAGLILPTLNMSTYNLSVSAADSISQNGPLTMSGGTVTISATKAATNVSLNLANDFGTLAPIFSGTLANIRDVDIRNINATAVVPTVTGLTSLRNLTLTFNNSPITLPSITLNNLGSLSVKSGGAITQTGILSIPGTASFDSGASPTTLSQANNFNGAISFVTTGANDVIVNNASNTTFGVSNIGGSFTATSTNGFTQSGVLTVAGSSSFITTNAAIILPLNNSLTGKVALSNSGSNSVVLTNTQPLILDTISVGQDIFLTSGGNITQVSTINASSGIMGLGSSVPNSDITLNAANDLGSLPIVFSGTRSNIRDVSLRNTNANAATPNFSSLSNLRNVTLVFDNAGMSFATTTLTSGGVLSLIAGGDITQTGPLTVPGTSSISVGTHSITLTQNNLLNGAITISNAGSNKVTLKNNTSTILAASTVGNDFSITSSGPITQIGVLIIPGNSYFAAGDNPIILTANNLLTGEISLSNTGPNDVALKNLLATIFGTVSVGRNLTVSSGGNVSQGYPITMTGGVLDMSITNPTSSIILSEDNNFGSYAPTVSGTKSNIVNYNLKNISTTAAMPSFTGFTNLHFLELSFPNANVPLSLLNMNGTAIFTANNVTGDLNVHGLQLDSNFCNLTGTVNGLSGQAAIDQIVLLNTIGPGTHFFDGIDMYGSTPPTPPTPTPEPVVTVNNSDKSYISNTLYVTNTFWEETHMKDVLTQYFDMTENLAFVSNPSDKSHCTAFGAEIEVCL